MASECAGATVGQSARRRILASGKADEKKKKTPVPVLVPATTEPANTEESKKEDKKEDKQDNGKGNENANTNDSKDVPVAPTPVPPPAPSTPSPVPTPAPTQALALAPVTPTPTAASTEPQTQTNAPIDTPAPSVESPSPSTQPSPASTAQPEPAIAGGGSVGSGASVVTSTDGNENPKTNAKDSKKNEKNDGSNESENGNGKEKANANANTNANKDTSISSIPVPTPESTVTGASTTPTPAPTSTDTPATPAMPTSAPALTDVPATPTSALVLTDVPAAPAPTLTTSPLDTNAVVDTSVPPAQPSSAPAPAPTVVPEPTSGGGQSLNNGRPSIPGVVDGAGDDSAVQTPAIATTLPFGITVVNDEGNKKNGDKKGSKKEDNKEENIDDNNGASNDDNKGDSNDNSTDLKNENEKDNENGDANVNGSKNTSNDVDVPTMPTPVPALVPTPGRSESPLETSALVETSVSPTQLFPVPVSVPVDGVVNSVNSESPSVPGVAGGDNAVKTPAVATIPPAGNAVVNKEASANAKIHKNNEKKESKKESKKGGNNKNSNSDKKEDDSNDDESSDEDANVNASNEVPTRPAPVPAPTSAPTEQQLETSAPVEMSAVPAQPPSAELSPVPAPVPTALPEPTNGASGASGEKPDFDGESEDKSPASATTPITGNANPEEHGHANANTNGNEKNHGKSNEKDHGKNNEHANGNRANDNVPATPAATEPQHQTNAPEDVPVPPVQSPPAQSSVVVEQPVVSANANEHASADEKEHGQGHGQGNGDAKTDVPTAPTTTQPQLEPSPPVNVPAVDVPLGQSSSAVAQPAQPAFPTNANEHATGNEHVDGGEIGHSEDGEKDHSKDNEKDNGNAKSDVSTKPTTSEPQIEPSAPVNAPPVDTSPAQSTSVAAQATQPANDRPSANKQHTKDNENGHSKDGEKYHSSDNGNAQSDVSITPAVTEPHLEPSTPVNEPAADTPFAQPSPVAAQPAQPVVSADANANDHADDNEHANTNGNGNNDVSATAKPQIDASTHVDPSVVAVDVPPVRPSLVVVEPVVPANANEHADEQTQGNVKEHENGNGKNDVTTTSATIEPQIDTSAHVDSSVVAVVLPPAEPSLMVVQPVVSANANKHANEHAAESDKEHENDNKNGKKDVPVTTDATKPSLVNVDAHTDVSLVAADVPPVQPSLVSVQPAQSIASTVVAPGMTVLKDTSSQLVDPHDSSDHGNDHGDTKSGESATPPEQLVVSATDKSTAMKEEFNSGRATSSSKLIAKSSPQLGGGGGQAILSDPEASSSPPASKAKSDDSDSRLKTESGQPGNAVSTAAMPAVEGKEGRAAEHAEVRNETRSDAHNSSVAVSSFVFDASSKSPAITVDKQLQLSESGDQLISKDPSKAVTLNLTPTSSITEEPEKYVRGQIIKSQLTTGSKGDDEANSDTDLPHVLGGKQRGISKQPSTSVSSAQVYESVRYSTSLAAGMSLALLACFHFVFMDPRLSWTSALWSPNSWEFVLYVQYLQQATLLSALTLLKTPYFLWEFTDTFSWTNFLVQHDEAGGSSSSEACRRLRTIVLDGLVGYSDRIGQDETKIMYHCVIGFVVAMVIVGIAFLVVTAIGKWRQTTENRNIARRILGLSVLVWYFSLFPLSLAASFEMQMEMQASLIETWPMSLSVLALFGVCSAGVAYGARVVSHKSEKELRRSETVAVWGVLYAYYTHPARMFFMFGASVQIVVGICIGVFGSSSTLLLLLVAIQLLCLIAVYAIEPFVSRVALVATYAVGAVKTVNLALAFAFLQSSEMSTANREIAANVYLGINALVIYVWLIRLLVVFCSCVAVWSDRKQRVSSTQSGMYTKDAPSSVQVEPSIREASEEHGYRTSISPAESAQMTAMALAPVSSSQTWSREQWERVV